MQVFKGIEVAPGVVIGPVQVLDDVVERVPHRKVPAEDVNRQLRRLEQSLDHACIELGAERNRIAAELGHEPAKIFDFQLGLLSDEHLISRIRDRIESEKVTAEYAVSEEFRDLADRFRSMGSDVFRQKAYDVMDLDRRVLGKLVGMSQRQIAEMADPVIIVAHELTPGQAAALDMAKVLGIATDAGGRTSHTSIVARALGVPVVVGLQRVSQVVNVGDQVILDGNGGVLIVHPDEETLAQYRADMARLAGFKIDIAAMSRLESVTLDGVHVELLGNIEFPHEVEAVLANGGEGVGLYRTEFLYLTSPRPPTEEEHFEAYARTIELLDGRPLTIRTLDLGADKYTQERAIEPERNPFLGCRSIRYCLQNLPLFKTQLRAILRASGLGPLKIMFPLISTAMELRQTKMIVQDVVEECEDEGIEFDREIPIGIMVEVPSAALMASSLAREVAFFSIGTNDLIQYTLAVDRGNERVANLYTAASPAVLQLVKAVIRAGKRAGVQTSLCGEIAGEILYTMLLLGLGLRTLSLVPSQIPHVKRVIRSVDIGTCERLARKVGSFDSERQVLMALREALQNVVPELAGGWSAG
jgi:phosphotransferase system enzyme I (PtsI)